VPVAELKLIRRVRVGIHKSRPGKASKSARWAPSYRSGPEHNLAGLEQWLYRIKSLSCRRRRESGCVFPRNTAARFNYFSPT
jgi:hypothetical protein